MTRPSRALITATFAMMAVVCASNYLVQFPLPLLPDWLTWGALTYPFAFLVTDLTNRLAGPACARRAVISGFALGVTLSVITATPRIALASGTAFLLGQLLDIGLFNRLRQQSWWKAPLLSSALGSILDTATFFSLAFAGTDTPWLQLGFGDLCVKLSFALLLLAPYRMAVTQWSMRHARG